MDNFLQTEDSSGRRGRADCLRLGQPRRHFVPVCRFSCSGRPVLRRRDIFRLEIHEVDQDPGCLLHGHRKQSSLSQVPEARVRRWGARSGGSGERD